MLAGVIEEYDDAPTKVSVQEFTEDAEDDPAHIEDHPSIPTPTTHSSVCTPHTIYSTQPPIHTRLFTPTQPSTPTLPPIPPLPAYFSLSFFSLYNISTLYLSSCLILV